MSERLRQIRVSDQVIKYIRDFIADNGLRSGDELPSESELSRRLGVSRPTIREATNSLAGIGIINVSSGRAPTVGSISELALTHMLGHGLATAQIDALQTLQVRSFIEGRSVGLAAIHRSEEDVAEIRVLAAGLKKHVGDLERFANVDMAFHKVLARASGNPLVRIIVEGIADVALESSRTGLRAIKTRAEWKRVVTAHEQVAAAVLAGDPVAAEARMKEHFDDALLRMARMKP